jgi:DNA mismatch endonuclease (patch repair protein)
MGPLSELSWMSCPEVSRFMANVRKPNSDHARRNPISQFENVAPVVRRRMSRIRKKDTKPELVVRRIAHRLGYRYRLHRRDLPGTPDLTFPLRRKVVLVHGCFWHQHDCQLGAKQPRVRPEYWLPKLQRNKERDARNLELLRSAGWSTLVLWECQLSEPSALARRLRNFLR